MSGYVHDPHDRDEHGRPLLFDGCPACEDHAKKRGLGLDEERFREAWAIMLEVEYGVARYGSGAGGGYRSRLEKELCFSLYELSLLMQRHFGIDPKRAIP